MKVWILGSGSRGNATLIDNGSSRVLIDAGFSARELKRRLAVADVAPESIEAVVVTHEHNDHACGAARAARKWQWPVYATRGTVANMPDLDDEYTRTFAAGEVLTFSSMTIQTVPISHDATDPIAVVATDVASGARAAVVIDLGQVSPELRRSFQNVDVLVVESNHDETLLAHGPYPISVQQRIASNVGHLSNRQAGAMVRACVHSGLQHVILAHLSESCNTPDRALATTSAAVARSRFSGKISAAAQDLVSGVYLTARPGGRAVQLGLGI